MDTVGAIVIPVVLVAAVCWALAREDVKLRRRARRYRELEFEGIEQLRSDDPYPEAGRRNGLLREPDGRAADTDRVLREELERAREHTRLQARRRSRSKTLRRGRGAECLL